MIQKIKVEVYGTSEGTLNVIFKRWEVSAEVQCIYTHTNRIESESFPRSYYNAGVWYSIGPIK